MMQEVFKSTSNVSLIVSNADQHQKRMDSASSFNVYSEEPLLGVGNCNLWYKLGRFAWLGMKKHWPRKSLYSSPITDVLDNFHYMIKSAALKAITMEKPFELNPEERELSECDNMGRKRKSGCLIILEDLSLSDPEHHSLKGSGEFIQVYAITMEKPLELKHWGYTSLKWTWDQHDSTMSMCYVSLQYSSQQGGFGQQWVRYRLTPNDLLKRKTRIY